MPPCCLDGPGSAWVAGERYGCSGPPGLAARSALQTAAAHHLCRGQMDSQTDAGERVPWPCPSHRGPRCHPPHPPSPPSIPQTAPPQLQPLFTAGCWGREPLHFGDNQGPGRGRGSRARRQSGWCGGRGRGKEGAGELGETVLLQWRRAESQGEGPGCSPTSQCPLSYRRPWGPEESAGHKRWLQGLLRLGCAQTACWGPHPSSPKAPPLPSQ